MSGLTHTIKQGDTEPPCRAILKDVDGTLAIIQAGDVVTFRMTPQHPGLRGDISATATVNDANAGDVQYNFVAADTATVGLYNAEFHIAYAGGVRGKTFPTDGYIVVNVEPKAVAT